MAEKGKQPPRRTLKRVVDLTTMETMTSDELLLTTPDEYQRIRRAATRAVIENRNHFVCEQCGHSVYAPREPRTRLPYWRHRKGAPKNCPWWTGDPASVDAVSARQFGGAQESPLHIAIKNHVAELLTRDRRTEAGSVQVDKYVAGEEDRRRPDVRAVYDGHPIAFEVQLATTQIPIIVSRETFYEREGFHLIWLTWRFEPVPRRRLLTAFEDIFYSHNKNFFSLDADVIEQSKANDQFMLRVFWEEGRGWETKVIALSDLRWMENGLGYVVAPQPLWHEVFRDQWVSVINTGDFSYEDQRALLEELAMRMMLPSEAEQALISGDIDSLLNCAMSLFVGRPVGSAQSNLTEVLNTTLYSPRRHRFAGLIRAFVDASGNSHLFKKKSVERKFFEALMSEQYGQNSIAGIALQTVFPEIEIASNKV